MGKRIVDFLRSDLAALILAAALCFLVHVATNGQYGFHRDELQTLDDARHLDWGFVVYPPITPLIGRIEMMLFGTSLIGFRVFAALAVSIVMILTGLTAKELGGKRHTQLLAAVAAGVAPISLVQGAVFQYVSFDYLWGVTVTYLLVRLVKSEDPRWWLPIGGVIGLGMETRYTMGVLALGVVGGVLLTPARRWLLNRWLWAGVALCILVFLPNLIWQAQHHFIWREFLSYLRARDLHQGHYDGFFWEQLLVNINVVTARLAITGLWFYFLHREGRRYRLLGWMFTISFAIFALVRSRSYYTAPLYPMLLAAGSVQLAGWLAGVRPVRARVVYRLQWAAIAVNGVVVALLLLPVAPIGSPVWKITSKLFDQFREEIGWPDLARSVAGVYDSLPAEERAHTGILTGNYGEAGALNLYGPALGLPHAMGLTNSFWYRGYDPRLPNTAIVTGFELEDGQKLFESCVVAGKNTNPYDVVNEESRYHPDILLCRNLRMAWPEYWASHRGFG
jgi:hypothetical protein